MNKFAFFLSIACLSQNMIADPIVSLFLRPYPEHTAQMQKMFKKLHKPKTVAKTILNNSLKFPQISGIFATYAGFLDVSNEDGELVFPRMHQKPFVYFLITPRISPIIMFENTLDQWELVPGVPAALYKATFDQDSETGLYFWKMTQEELPKDNVIPPLSITILAKPDHIYVPTGITLTEKSPNILLPNIYVKKGIDIVKHSLFIINLAQWLRPVKSLYKKEPKRYDMLSDY